MRIWWKAISPNFPASIKPAMRAIAMKMAMSTSWPALTTSSMSRAIAFQRVAWKRCCPHIKVWQNAGVNQLPAELEQEIVALVRDKIGPVAAFKIAVVVNRLPKTRSGKILRGTMKKIADADAWTMPAAIEDPATLSEIAAALQRRGT